MPTKGDTLHYLRHGLAVCAVALAALIAAPIATAHPNLTASASQVCDTTTGSVELVANFSNAGFDTVVTASDSQGGTLGTGTAPASFAASYPGPDRAAGVVSFEWHATDGDGGTITAAYEAVSGCTGPTTTTTPPPPPPHHSGGGPTPRIGTPVNGSIPREAVPATPQTEVHSRKALPYTGDPLVKELAGAFVLVAAALGVGVYARKRYPA